MIKAYAKLNLGLAVEGKRDDGYHQLKMVTIPVDLFDVLTIKKSDDIKIRTNKWFLPNDENNTLYKTLQVMHQELGIDPNYSIRLVKNIPTQAGLGGGSSDAAALIKYLNDSLALNLSMNELIKLGIKVGSDVPYCIYSRPAIVEGVGEIITPIKVNCPFFLFLMKPKFGISTGQLFNDLQHHQNSLEQIDQLVEGLTTNQYDLVKDNLVNDLQSQAIHLQPMIQTMIDELIAFGFDGASMTGAGSVVFGITQDEELVKRAVTHFVDRYSLVKKSRIPASNL